MLFQDAPPDTSGYMIAGYAIFIIISIIYVVSLAVRRRNLELDLRTLEAMQAESKSPPRGIRSGQGGKAPKKARKGRK
jgi:hypothetical protein